MNSKLKNRIKSLPFINFFIFNFIHPHIKSNIVKKNIDNFFFDIAASSENFKKIPQISNLIISLTSFPARMKYIEFTLFSLIQQTIRPEKIILWLSEKEFPDKKNNIPSNIFRYESFGLEIRFVKENYKSFNKLVFALKEFPDYSIVTIDDDVFYKADCLELLFSTHKSFPTDIISNKIRKISFTKKNIDPYSKWKMPKSGGSSFLNFLLGYGGVLYPPNSLHTDSINDSLFLKLSPNADDIWFYSMALLAKTKIRKPKYFFSKSYPLDYQLTNEWENIPELIKINISENKNDSQLKIVLTHYSIYDNFYNLFISNDF